MLFCDTLTWLLCTSLSVLGDRTGLGVGDGTTQLGTNIGIAKQHSCASANRLGNMEIAFVFKAHLIWLGFKVATAQKRNSLF